MIICHLKNCYDMRADKLLSVRIGGNVWYKQCKLGLISLLMGLR